MASENSRIVSGVEGHSLDRLVRWIPVAEKLPEGDEVLYWDGEQVSTFFPCTGDTPENEAAARCASFGITHWMPMPIPPNDQAERLPAQKL
jgi:hypothetical protein